MQTITSPTTLKSYVKLTRIHQWTKNLFIFIPAFFAQVLFEEKQLAIHIIGFFSFSLIASAVYILNDYLDIEKDRLHPKKSKRPLASGSISLVNAKFLFVFCLISGFILAYNLDKTFLLIVGFYFLMNLGYTFALKQISLVDVTIISVGFLLRVFSGAVLADVVVSKWLILMTFLLSLLLAFAKRRDDVLIRDSSGKEMRKSINGYNITFVNVAMVFVASITVVAYIMYTVSPEVIERIHHDNIYLTSFFVILGILRYLQITLVEEKSGSPSEVLLKDLFIQITVCGWILSFVVFLYIM